MILSGKDKLYHLAACALITIATFLALSLARRFQERRRRFSMAEEGPSDLFENSTDVEAPRNHDVVHDISEKSCFTVCTMENWVLVGMSSVVALSIGILKEIGDIYNFWWLCQVRNEDGSIAGCDASWGDLLADIFGIILAQAIIFISLLVWNAFVRANPRFSLNYYHVARTACTDT